MVFLLMRKSFITQPTLFAPQGSYARPVLDGLEGVVDWPANTHPALAKSRFRGGRSKGIDSSMAG